MILYWAALVITGVIKCTSCDCLYQEVGKESLADSGIGKWGGSGPKLQNGKMKIY